MGLFALLAGHSLVFTLPLLLPDQGQTGFTPLVGRAEVRVRMARHITEAPHPPELTSARIPLHEPTFFVVCLVSSVSWKHVGCHRVNQGLLCGSRYGSTAIAFSLIHERETP